MPSERDLLEWLVAGQGRIESKLNRLLELEGTVIEKEDQMTQEIDDLNAALGDLQTTADGLATQATANEAEVTSLLAQLQTASTNGDAAGVEAAVAKIKALNASLTTTTQGLAAAIPAPVTAPTPAAITLSGLSMTGPAGTAFTAALGISGGVAPYTVSSSPASDNGLSVGSDGTVSGTPTDAAVSTFNVSVSDASSPPLTATGQITFTGTAASS